MHVTRNPHYNFIITMEFLENYFKINNFSERIQFLRNSKNISEDLLYKTLKLKYDVQKFLENFQDLLSEKKENGHFM